jgi:hypothetical protein
MGTKKATESFQTKLANQFPELKGRMFKDSEQVGELDSAFAGMAASIIGWTVDLSVSLEESDALEISMAGVQSQADDLIAIATSLAPVPETSPVSDITAAKTEFSDFLDFLLIIRTVMFKLNSLHTLSSE